MAKAAEAWSPSSMIQDALDSDLDPGIFSSIDESDVLSKLDVSISLLKS